MTSARCSCGSFGACARAARGSRGVRAEAALGFQVGFACRSRDVLGRYRARLARPRARDPRGPRRIPARIDRARGELVRRLRWARAATSWGLGSSGFRGVPQGTSGIPCGLREPRAGSPQGSRGSAWASSGAVRGSRGARAGRARGSRSVRAGLARGLLMALARFVRGSAGPTRGFVRASFGMV